MLIPRWDQARLSESHLLIVGSDALAAVIAVGATALGVGRVTLLHDAVVGREQSDHFLCDGATPGTPRVRVMETALRALNPDVTVSSVVAQLVSDVQLMTLPRLHLVIVANGDACDVAVCAAYAHAQNLPLIIASANTTEGACAVWLPSRERTPCRSPSLTETTDREQTGNPSMAVSCVIGGLALSEARACLLPFWSGEPLFAPPMLRYNLAHPQRFLPAGQETIDHTTLHSPRSIPIRHLVLVGAGGLGTWFGLAAVADSLTRLLTVFDPDVIEEHNLNRQILFTGAVGQPKATTLAARLRSINSDVRTTGVGERIPPEFISDHHAEIDGVIAAVDNFRTRALLQQECGENGLPLINGGSGALQAEVAIYAPGQTACLNCVMDLKRLAQRESDQPTSCAAAPEASTVIANMIAGGLMAAETRNLLTDPPNVPRGVIAYDAFAPPRVGLRSKRSPCRCFERSR
jgi:molybdopterin/thiamine biosynthesis adenylyltransferase